MSAIADMEKLTLEQLKAELKLFCDYQYWQANCGDIDEGLYWSQHDNKYSPQEMLEFMEWHNKYAQLLELQSKLLPMHDAFYVLRPWLKDDTKNNSKKK